MSPRGAGSCTWRSSSTCSRVGSSAGGRRPRCAATWPSMRWSRRSTIAPLARRPLVHHSDRGVQYLSIRYTERLAQAGIEPSVGSTGDSHDSALAESVIGLFKTEEIHRRGPWKGLEDVEFATLEWVAWYNGSRLLEPLGYVPPAEFETAYHDRQAAPVSMAVLT